MERISAHVTVFTSRAVAEMTSGVVVSAGEALLVDPGVLPDEIEVIARFVAAEGAEVTTLLLTHHHWDHVLATQRWPRGRRVAHPAFDAALASAEEPLAPNLAATYREHGFDPPADFAVLPIDDHLDDGATLTVGALRGQLIHLPGHAADALGLWLPEERLLFSSDMLDSNELPMPMQDVNLHLDSLAKIEALVTAGAVEVVVPGHGPVLRGREAILRQLASDRRYLETLRSIALDAIARGEDFERAWPRFAAMPYFDKGTPERDEEHRSNAEVTLRRLGGQ